MQFIFWKIYKFILVEETESKETWNNLEKYLVNETVHKVSNAYCHPRLWYNTKQTFDAYTNHDTFTNQTWPYFDIYTYIKHDLIERLNQLKHTTLWNNNKESWQLASAHLTKSEHKMKRCHTEHWRQ